MALPTTDDFKKIANLYVALFNRAPDTAGLNFWANALANGASASAITQGFLTAPEGVTTYPAGQTAEAFIRAFYQTTFGRAPDDGGLQFWLTALQSAGGVGSTAARAQVVSQISTIVSTALTAAESASSANAQTALDRALFANKIEYGLFLATQTTLAGDAWLAANLALNKVTADAASVVALKTALVTSQPGGGGVVVDASKVFTFTDVQLNTPPTAAAGGTGIDSLALTITTAANIAVGTANVQNVERITVYTDVNAAATTMIDAGRFVNATTFISASAKNLSFTNLLASQTGVVTRLDAGNNAITNGNSDFTYANGVTAGSVSLTGGLSQGTVAAFGTNLASVSISTSQGPIGVTGIQVGSSVNALAINAVSSLVIGTGGITGNTGNSLAITVTGAGSVDFSTAANSAIRPALLSLNASGNSGGVLARISGDNTRATTVIGGSGNDAIRLYGTFGANTSVNLGDGNDTLSGEGATFGAGSEINGGAGTNTLSFYALGQTNGAVFRNFQVLNVTANTTPTPAFDRDLTTLTNTTITSLLLGAGKAVDNTVLNVTQNLLVTGNAATPSANTTLGITGAAVNNYTITFNNAAAASTDAGLLTIASVVGLNIVSGGASGAQNKITLSDAALKTLVITGTSSLQVAFSAATTATDSINASALTNGFTLDTTNVVAGAGGLTITGSTNFVNTLTIAQKASVTVGAAADIVNLKNLGVAGTTLTNITDKLVTITNFGVGDKVDFGTITGGTVSTSLYIYTPAGGAALDVAVAAAVVASTAQNVAAKEFAAFALAGDTYVVADIDHSGTFNAGDVVVKLAGVVSLTGATVDVAGAIVTIPAGL